MSTKHGTKAIELSQQQTADMLKLMVARHMGAAIAGEIPQIQPTGTAVRMGINVIRDANEKSIALFAAELNLSEAALEKLSVEAWKVFTSRLRGEDKPQIVVPGEKH